MEVESAEIADEIGQHLESPGAKCRVCLKKCEEYWELFRDHEDIPRRMMALAAVQIEEGDGLPTIICYPCRQLVDVSYDFKCQVEKSDTMLREVLASKVSMECSMVKASFAQSVNAVITEAIADELAHKEITDNLADQIEIQQVISIEDSHQPIARHIEHLTVQNLSDEQETITFEISEGCTQVQDQCNSEGESIRKFEHEEKLETEMDSEENENALKLVSVTDNANLLIESGEEIEPIKQEELSLAEESELSETDDGHQDCEPIFEEEKVKIEIKKDLHSDSEERARSKKRKNSEEVKEEIEDSDEEKPLISRTQRQKCPHCIKTFATKLALHRHMAVHKHKTKLRYVCYLCDKQFSNVTKLKSHVTNSHNSFKSDGTSGVENNTDQIMQSEKSFEELEKDTSSSLDASKVEKKTAKMKCKVCEKQFTYQKSFLSHIKMHPEYQSEDLDGSSDQPDPLDVRQENQNPPFGSRENESDDDDDMPLEGLQCTQCGKLFATKRNLKRHISTHDGLKFHCTTCDKEFSRVDKLKEHRQSKHKEEMYGPSDEEDDDDTENENKTNDGMEHRKKDKNSRPHKCAMCPKAFAQPQSLANHMERHKRVKETQKRFLCEVCSKCFAQSGSLVAHMRTHTGVKPYVCNVCSRAFTKSTYLQLHLRTHSGEKPYICQYCSRAFARANTLARHITMHTGEAKYHCQICMKSFRRLTSLNEHTYTHTGQRPYACKICTKRYNNAGSLYAHTKKCKAQQLSGPTPTYTVSVENTSHQNGGAVPQMLIYSQRKLINNEPQVGQVPTTPQFMLTNVQSQKPLPTNIIQPFTIEDPNFYTVNTKQFKNPYYTIYPNM